MSTRHPPLAIPSDFAPSRLFRYHIPIMPVRSLILLLLFAAALTGCSNSVTVSADAAAPNTVLARELNDRAYDLLHQNKYTEARPLLEKAVAADPFYGPAHNNLGLVLYQQNDFYRAATEFDVAIKRMPWQSDARNNLGLVYERLYRYTEAIEQYERARKAAPDNAEYLANLTRTRFKQDPRDPALRPLYQELAFKTTDPEWRNWAQLRLLQMNARPIEPGPTTAPLTPPR